MSFIMEALERRRVARWRKLSVKRGRLARQIERLKNASILDSEGAEDFIDRLRAEKARLDQKIQTLEHKERTRRVSA
jgi:hypothetical protein